MRRFFKLVLLVLCATLPARAAVVFDKAANTGASSAATLAITPTTSGNALFVLVFSGSSAAISVADNVNSGGYTSVGAAAHNSIYQQWFYHINCAASATTITVTGASSPAMIAYSLSGVSAVSPVSGYQTGTGSTTALTTTSVTVTFAGSMILAGWGDGAATSVTPYITAGTNYSTSASENVTYVPGGAEHYNKPPTGTVTVTATATESSPTWSGNSFVVNPACMLSMSIGSLTTMHTGCM